MSEYFDEYAELKFRKRQKFNESIQREPIDDVLSTKSSSFISTSSPVILSKARPAGVPVAEYLQHIPNDWTTADKLRQLMIWFGQKALDDEIPKPRLSIADKVKIKLMEKLRTSPTLINVLHNLPDLKALSQEKNTTNVKNDKDLKQYSQDIKDIKSELEQWDRCENDIYEQHALARDKLTKAEERSRAVIDINDDFMDQIEPSQREYLDGCFDVERDEAIRLKDNVSNMAMEVTQLRQTLSIATHMNQHAVTLAEQSKVALAHKIQDISRVVPMDADKRQLGLFEDTGATRKQDELLHMESALRLLCKSKDPNQ